MDSDFLVSSTTGLVQQAFQLYVQPPGGLILKRFSDTGVETESVTLDANGVDGSVVVDSGLNPFVYVSYRRPGTTTTVNSEIVVKKFSTADISTALWTSVYQLGGEYNIEFPKLYITGSPAKNPNVVFTQVFTKTVVPPVPVVRTLVNLTFNALSSLMTKRTELKGLIGTTTGTFQSVFPSELYARAFGLNVYIAFPESSVEPGTGVTLVKLNGKTGVRAWNKNLYFQDNTLAKTGIRIAEDAANSVVYVYAKSGTERRVTAINLSNGNEIWTSANFASELSQSYNTDIQGFEMFLDVLSVQTVLTTGNLKTFKLRGLDGLLTSSRTTPLTGFTDVGSNISCLLPYPGDKVYIPLRNLSNGAGRVFYQAKTSVRQVDYPSSEVGQNQLVTNANFTQSYLVYRDTAESKVKLAVINTDNSTPTPADYIIDADGGQLPSVTLSGNNLAVQTVSFFTNFTEYVQVKIFYYVVSNLAATPSTSVVEFGDSLITDIHPVLTSTSSAITLFVRRETGLVSGYVFSTRDRTLTRSGTVTGLRISSKLSYGVVSSSVFISGIKTGDYSKIVGRLLNISSLIANAEFDLETDLGDTGNKTESYIVGVPSSTDFFYVGAYVSGGGLRLEKLNKKTRVWAVNSGITGELGGRVSGFSSFEDNLLVFTRNSSTGFIKTYKYGLTGTSSSTDFNPASYFPSGSAILPPVGSSTGPTIIQARFPYDKYVVVSKTSDTAGQVRISNPQLSVLHGNHRYTGTFTNMSSVLTITSTQNHGLAVGDFVSIDFTSGSMMDGLYRVTTVDSLTEFKIDYGAAGIASGNLSFTREKYLLDGSSDLTDYQTAYHEGSRILAYVDKEEFLTVKVVPPSGLERTLVLKNTESAGQFPSILPSGSDLYLSFASVRRTLTDILYLNVKKLGIENLNSSWSVGTRYFPDSDKTLFQTRLVEMGDRLNVYHFREDRLLRGNPLLRANGSLFPIQTTTYALPSSTLPSTTVLKKIPETDFVEFVYPDGLQVRYITFKPLDLTPGLSVNLNGGDTLGTKTNVATQDGTTSTDRYLVFNSGTDNRVVRFNYTTGVVSWQVPVNTLSTVHRLYAYLGYVLLFSITASGQISTLKLDSVTGSVLETGVKTTPLAGFPSATLVGRPVFYSEPDWSRAIIFLKNSLSGGVETSAGNYIEYSLYTSGVEASVTHTVSELSEFQSAIQPVLILEGATYSQTENILTVTYPNHGILLNTRVGLRFTSGAASSGSYDVIVQNTDSFKVMMENSLTATGGATIHIFDNSFTCYYTDAENGIEMTKFTSEGVQYQTSIDPLGQFPSLLHDESQSNYLYVSYMKNVTSFVDYLKLVVKRVDTFDLSDDWVSGTLFVDTLPNTFRPRMAVTGQGLHVAYCRSSNLVEVTSFDKINGSLINVLNTGVSLTDPSRLNIRGTETSTLYLGYTQASDSHVRKYTFNGTALSSSWVVSFDGGDVGLKQNLSIRESLDGVIVSYTSGTSSYLTRLQSTGVIDWTTDVTESGTYGDKPHGFYTLSGSPLVMFVVPRTLEPNLADLVCKKYEITGGLATTRTTFLESFDKELVVGPPLVFSRSYINPFIEVGNVFNSIWMVYPDPTGPIYPNWVFLMNRLETTPLPILNFSLVQTTDNQYARDAQTGNLFSTYINEPQVTNGVYINRADSDGITRAIRKVDSGGYGSVISVDEDSIYMAYSKNVLTYTDYLTIEIRKYTRDDFTPVWAVTRVFTDTEYEYFFPRIRVQGPNLFMTFTDQTGKLTVERYSAATGSLLDFLDTGFTLQTSELGELATWSSDNYFYLSLPKPSSDLIRLQKYGVIEGVISRIYSIEFNGGQTGQKSGILLRTPEGDLYPQDENLVIGFSIRSSSKYLVSKILSSGTSPAWTTEIGTFSDGFTQRMVGLGLYGDYVQGFLMRNVLGDIKIASFKLSPSGSLIQSNTTSTPLLAADMSSSVNGGTPITIQVSPIAFSSRDWSTLYIEFYVRASIPYGELVSPYDRLVITALAASPEYTIEVPVSELSTYQFAKAPSDLVTDTFVVYRHETEGVKISKTNVTGTVVKTEVVDPNGQSPSLTILQDSVYVSYIYVQRGFLTTIYHLVVCYDLNLGSRTVLSAYNFPDVDSTRFRPRITSSLQRLKIHYTREDNQILEEKLDVSVSEPVSEIYPLVGRVFGGTDYLHLSNLSDEGGVTLTYPTNVGETSYVILRRDLSGDFLWEKTLTHTSAIVPLTRSDESGILNVYYKEGSNYRFYNYDSETGVQNWTVLHPVSNLVGNEVGNVYFVLGYTLVLSLLTTNKLSALKFTDEGAFVNNFETNLTSVVSSTDVDGRFVLLSDNPWNNLYYAHYTSNSGLGSIQVSPTKYIEVSAYAIPTFHPLPIPSSELSEYQVAETSGHLFVVQSDETNGLVVVRVDKLTNTLTHTFTLPAADYAFAPSLVVSGSNLYLVYVDYVTTFIEFVRLRVATLDVADLSLTTTDIQSFPDPIQEILRPRPCVTEDYLHIGLIRLNREVYVLPYNPTDRTFGRLLDTGISALGLDPLSLGILSTSDTVTLALPDLTKNVLLQRYIETIDPVQNTFFEETFDWTLSLDADDTTNKTRPRMRADGSGNIYLVTNNLVVQVSGLGVFNWATSLAGVGSRIGTTAAHGFHLFEEYPLVQTILTGNQVAYGKLNEKGEQWSSRTTALGGVSVSDISGNPVVVSYYPYTKTHTLFQSSNTGLYNLPGRNLVFLTSDVIPTYVKPSPANKNIEGYQGTTFTDGSANAVYYEPSFGSRLYYFNGTSITLTSPLSSNGIYPSISKFQNETPNVVEYLESVIAFTEHQRLYVKQVNGVTLGTIWSQETILPYHVPPVTLVRAGFETLYVLVLQDNKYLNIQLRRKSDGVLLSTYTSNEVIERVEDVRLMGQDDLYVSFPVDKFDSGNNFIGSCIRVMRFNSNGELLPIWTVDLADDANQKFHVRLTQNLTGSVFVTYIGKESSNTLGFTKILAIDRLDGGLIWSKTLFDDINPLTERIHGLDNEGSYVNVSRLDLTLLDTEPSTFVLVTKNNTYTGLTKSIENTLTGFSAYVDNPLVIYNQGDGWVILMYVNTLGSFSIVRQEVTGGADRIDYTSEGKVDYNVPGKNPQTSSVEYPYYWRPRITINPEIYPSNQKQYTLTNGKFTGLYKEWWNNGHLRETKVYDLNGNLSGRHVIFERTGQHRFETTTYTGNGFFREWTPPSGTNLSALFLQYVTNPDGFMYSNDLDTLLEEYGGLELTPEDLASIFAKLDENGDGKISREEFVRGFGINPFTRDIPSKDLDHSVLITECPIVNGKKTGNQLQYHPFRPDGKKRVESTFDSQGRLHGSYKEYYYDGTTEKLAVQYVTGNKSGTQTERYSPDLGGGISRVTVFVPGAQSTDIKEYYPSGSWKSIFEPFTDPVNPFTEYRFTEYFDKTPRNLDKEAYIYRRYFLDEYRLKVGLETLYSSPLPLPGVVQPGWPKSYERGKVVV